MSRARHKEEKKRAMGGSTKPVWEAGGETNAAKEAEDKKEGSEMAKGRRHGGMVHGEGEKSKHRADRRARGGKVEHHGTHKPGRKAGGGIGANLTPLSTAARIKEVTKGEDKEDEHKSD